MFKDFKKAFQNNFAALLIGQQTLYVTNVEKDTLWETYLNSYPEDVRQEYNCSACRHFIKNYGNVVAIVNNQIRTIWDFSTGDAIYDNVAENLHHLVAGQSDIRDVFVTKFPKLGTDKNVDGKKLQETGVVHTWEHFFYQLPAQFVSRSSESEEAIQGQRRAVKEVFKRSLEELKPEAIDTTLDLISQNSIYRGAEFKGMIEAFQQLQKKYLKLKAHEKDNFCWVESMKGTDEISKIRNTSIGTFLIDISNEVDIEEALRKFERVMAPSNYKRPNAIITKKMTEEAEKTVIELGLSDSLGRRFATPEDVTVNDVLFVNRDAKKAGATDIFGQLKESVPVNPKSFSKVEEVSMQDFITKILPRTNSIEVFLENKHSGNFVSLIAPQNTEAPSLFKWDNNFSWSYKDAMADGLKEKVKAAGGKVEGKLRISLEWFNYDDLDLHLRNKTSGKTIYFGATTAIQGGHLDVDMNAGSGTTRTPVENIIFPGSIPNGNYDVLVDQFRQREKDGQGFNVEVEYEGEVSTFGFDSNHSSGTVKIASFTYNNGNFTLLTEGGTAKTTSRNIWGLDTNKFQKVSMITKSPNYWGTNKSGNEHLFFILEGAKNEETVRGFFNEFLKEDLIKHKRVFEALGGRMKVAPADKQLSGIGFSSTTKGELIVKVEGNVSRTLKIKF